jgi:hypothetical protein
MTQPAQNSISVSQTLRYWASRLGNLGVIGLVLLAGALAYWLLVVQGGERSLLSKEQSLASLQAQSRATITATGNKVAASTGEQIEAFYKNFPISTEAPNFVSKIFKAADKNLVVLDTGEYNWSSAGNERLAQYKVALPVKGPYVKILGFIDMVLQQTPSAALESVSFKRQKPTDDIVDAKLVFVLYFRQTP